MELVNKNGPAAPGAGGELVINAIAINAGGGATIFRVIAARNNLPVMTMDLTVLGGDDPVQFLSLVAKEIYARRSPIVRPS